MHGTVIYSNCAPLGHTPVPDFSPVTHKPYEVFVLAVMGACAALAWRRVPLALARIDESLQMQTKTGSKIRILLLQTRSRR